MPDTKRVKISSPTLQVGEVWQVMLLCPAGFKMSHIDVRPEVWAWFELESGRSLTADEVSSCTFGRARQPGFYIRVKNKGSSPACFAGLVRVEVDELALERQLTTLAEEAWQTKN